MKFFNHKQKLGSSVVLLFALIYLNATFSVPVDRIFAYEVFTARTLPILLSILAIIVCLIQMFMPAGEAAEETISDAIAGFQWKPFFLLTGSMLVYGLTFNFLGFLIGTFLFLLVGFVILKEKRFLLAAAVSGGMAAFMWIVLTQLFNIYLDSGDLYRIMVQG